MSSPDEAWLSLLVVALFGLLVLLRLRFPDASKGAETAVLLSATILFFLICNVFLGPNAHLVQHVQARTHDQKQYANGRP